MRKKVGNEVGVFNGERREREESMHRKAAALAWFKHGRKGSSFIGSGRGSKMQNPLMHAPRRHQASSNCALEGNYGAINDEDSMGAMLMPPTSIETPYHNLSSIHQAPYNTKHQASRFKAEALALQSSSSSSSSTITTTSNKPPLINNMTTGQSLALLSLLPHHQSQKCFKNRYAATSADTLSSASTPWDCGSSLYDSFELLCLSNQLGRCLTTVNASATATASSSSSSSSYSKLIKNLVTNPLQGPSLQPSYIPRSLYSLPQFMIPNYLVAKSSNKKRSSLIHPLFSIPNATNSTPPPCLPAPPLSPSPVHSQSTKSQSVADDHSTRKKTESSSGFRRVFNSLLKTLHMKEDPAHQKPKRSNLSEELEKLPKNRPASSKGAARKYEDPEAAAMALNGSPNAYFSTSGAEMASKRSPTMTAASASSTAAAMESRRSLKSSSAAAASHHHHFRNEGFRTTSKPPKSVKWLQPGAS